MSVALENPIDSTLIDEKEYGKYNNINYGILNQGGIESKEIYKTDERLVEINPIEQYLAQTKRESNNKEIRIISNIDGVVLSFDEDCVRVKLKPDTYANLLSVLFEDRKKIKEGQHIRYFIKEDTCGYRYQEVEAIENIEPHPEKEFILNMLDNIKLKDE